MFFQDISPSLALLRLDLVGGNKPLKLKLNLEFLRQSSYKRLLTFGGAHSNHLRAAALACAQDNIPLVAVVRGEAATVPSPTLRLLQAHGVEIQFISRSEYREKDYTKFQENYPDCYVLPEGGANRLAVLGVSAIMTYFNERPHPDYLCVCVGTGATAAGLVHSFWNSNTHIIGYSVLKNGAFLYKDIYNLLCQCRPEAIWEEFLKKFSLKTDYHFGGYAKTTAEMRLFQTQFEAKHNLRLDQVYTAKMLYGICNESAFFKDTKTVALHTYNPEGEAG